MTPPGPILWGHLAIMRAFGVKGEGKTAWRRLRRKRGPYIHYDAKTGRVWADATEILEVLHRESLHRYPDTIPALSPTR